MFGKKKNQTVIIDFSEGYQIIMSLIVALATMMKVSPIKLAKAALNAKKNAEFLEKMNSELSKEVDKK